MLHKTAHNNIHGSSSQHERYSKLSAYSLNEFSEQVDQLREKKERKSLSSLFVAKPLQPRAPLSATKSFCWEGATAQVEGIKEGGGNPNQGERNNIYTFGVGVCDVTSGKFALLNRVTLLHTSANAR